MEPVKIDGSMFEGGGSIVRFAAAMSAVTSKPVTVTNIRENRPQPGLKHQHLEGIRALARLCNAKLVGDAIGSREITFIPSTISLSQLDIKLSTAASIGLVFQTLKIPASLGKGDVKIHIKGGATAGLWSPPVRYIQNITLPVLSKTGYRANISILRDGFYPKGGAEVLIEVEPWKEKTSINAVERGKPLSLKILSVASSFLKNSRVAERQAESARHLLERETGLDADVRTFYTESVSPGSVIVAWLETENSILGGDAIGRRGVRSEDIGKSAASQLLEDFKTGACLDRHLSDQIIAHMALSPGPSSVTIPSVTGHVRANISVVERFLPVKFEARKSGKHFILRCSGQES